MAHAPASNALDTTLRLAERAIRNPASTIWLDHVCLTSHRFEDALKFYVRTLGLSLRTVEGHPFYPDRMRALFIDAEGRDVLEIIDGGDPDTETARLHLGQLGFALPKRSWMLLRARLDAQDVPYEETPDRLYFKDVDGTLLKIASLGSC